MSRTAGPPGARGADVGVLIPAGGRGERVGPGIPKQFRLIAGVPMLLRTIRPFAAHPRVVHIIVALPHNHVSTPPDWLRDLTGDSLAVVRGGTTRAASVRSALGALSQGCTVVLVHDAVRPFVSRETIDAVIAMAGQGYGAVPCVPVADTLKRTGENGRRVTETVSRDGLWRAQTPQGFPRTMLEEAFTKAGDRLDRFTDEAAMVEAIGLPVDVVPDLTSNIKVTTPDDFLLADAIATR